MITSRVLEDLPADILALLEDETQPAAPTVEQLTRIGQALETRKKEAIDGRQQSGIEDTWILCEEAYAGIDDVNRHEFNGNRWMKPPAMNQPLTRDTTNKMNTDRKSTAFVRLTSRYVDAGYAKINEILLTGKEKAFSLVPTPVPDLLKGMGDETPITDPQLGPLTRPATPPPQDPNVPIDPNAPPPPDVPLTTKDLAEEAMDRAVAGAKLAEKIIWDWQVECGHHLQMRKVMFDAARLGVGISKGPYPDKKRRMVRRKGPDRIPTLEIKEDIVPVDSWVSPWDIFPDPSCGENIHDGDYIWERKRASERQVRKLKGMDGYLDSQIDAVLAAGPRRSTHNNRNPTDIESANEKQYEIWTYTGTMDREDFEVLNPKASATVDAEREIVFVVATMINDIVVRGAINPLDTGRFTYHAVPWIRRPGHWAGVGIAEQVATPQRIVNAATRAMLNNAGISAGPQIVIDYDGVHPADDDYRLYPNKIWYKTKDGMTDDVQKAFYSFDVTNVEGPLMNIINYGMRLAEESTSIPLITQGQSGATTPETLGATQLQNNNANQLLRAIGYNFDSYMTGPQTEQYYEYLLLDPTVDEAAKGDLSIEAQGSVAMVERSIQNQATGQMMPMVVNPAFGVDPKRYFAVWAKSQYLNPKDFQFTPEEQAKIDAQPKPAPPAIEVAKIKAEVSKMELQAEMQRAEQADALARELAQLDAQSAQEIAKLQNTTAQLRAKLDTDRDTVYVRAEAARAQADFTHNMKLLELKREIALMEQKSKQQEVLDTVKAKLADTAMKLQVQKELAAMDTHLAIKQHTTPSAKDLMKPPTNRPGKAGNGKAFTQGR